MWFPRAHRAQYGRVDAANIGPEGCRRRFRWGVAQLVIGTVLAAVLLVTGVPRMWRLAAFLPFAGAGAGIFQARAKT